MGSTVPSDKASDQGINWQTRSGEVSIQIRSDGSYVLSSRISHCVWRIARTDRRSRRRWDDRQTPTRLAGGDRERLGSDAATVIWIGRDLSRPYLAGSAQDGW